MKLEIIQLGPLGLRPLGCTVRLRVDGKETEAWFDLDALTFDGENLTRAVHALTSSKKKAPRTKKPVEMHAQNYANELARVAEQVLGGSALPGTRLHLEETL